MTFKCDVCGNTFAKSDEHFPIKKGKICICNNCMEEMYEDYQYNCLDNYQALAEMEAKQKEAISKADIGEEDKNFALSILQAYMVEESGDFRNLRIRDIVDTLVFGVRDLRLKDLVDSSISDNALKEEDREKFYRLINIFLSEGDDESELAKIVTNIAEGADYAYDDEAECDEEEEDINSSNNSAEDTSEFHLEPVNMPVNISKVKEFIKCQDEGVVQIGGIFHQHINRIRYNSEHPDDMITSKPNFILVGPTGVGKTATIEEFAKLVGLPVVVIDMTSITKAGYIGTDIEDYFKKLITIANNDIRLAEHGIVILDEGDKNIKNGSRRSDDPGGQAIMFELLKKLEGADVALDHKGKFFNTKNVLFGCLGTFEEAYTCRKERLTGKKSMGFQNETKKEEVATKFIPEDFIKSGAISEWCGRFPSVVEFKSIDGPGYLHILHNSSKSPFVQKKKLIQYSYGIDLVLLPEGEKKLVADAVKYNVGVRGLDRAVSEMINDAYTKLMMGEIDCKRVIMGETIKYE